MQYEIPCPRCRKVLFSRGPQTSGLTLAKHLRAVVRSHLKRWHPGMGERDRMLAVDRAVRQALARVRA